MKLIDRESIKQKVQVKFNELPESIVIKGTEYFLERYVSTDSTDTMFKDWVGFTYKNSKDGLPPNVLVNYPNGKFEVFLSSFDKTEQEAYDDLLYRINNIVE